MTERLLAPAARILLGVLGAIALGGGLTVGLSEVRALSQGAPLVKSVLLIGVCTIVTLGGIRLLRGAINGRITVRNHASRQRSR